MTDRDDEPTKPRVSALLKRWHRDRPKRRKLAAEREAKREAEREAAQQEENAQ